MNRCRIAVTMVLLTLLSIPASGATFVVPDDETFIRKADVIVTGTILSEFVQYADDGGIETRYQLLVDEVLKGDPGESTVEFREWGGRIGNRFMAMSGAPSYEIGKRYLIFMTPFRDGTLTTLDLTLGRFEFLEMNDEIVVQRDMNDVVELGERSPRTPRRASAFLEKIRQQVRRDRERGASAPVVVEPRVNNLDTKSAAEKGSSEWSGGTTVNYSVSSTPATGDTKDTSDPEERIIIDDPHNDISGTFTGSGTVATAFYGGFFGSGRIVIDGSDIVVQDGVSSANLSQANYNTTITHEMGHTLGFRHSNQNKYNDNGSACAAPLPCSTTAVMNSQIVSGLNGNLSSWDQTGVDNNYGSSPDPDYLTHDKGSDLPWYRNSPNVQWRLTGGGGGCAGPTINSGPSANPSSINTGQSSTLSVSATASEGSLTYQWYVGSSGNTSNPVAGGTNSSVVVSPTTTTSYWVRVTDGCATTPSVNSGTVTVTVTGPCTGPTINTGPRANPVTITQGQSSTLSVSATASQGSLSYQWYIGSSGDAGNPVPGGTGASVIVSPTATTTYWVRVTDGCDGGTSLDSSTVTVTVQQCQAPVITVQPQDTEVEAGKSVTLTTGATGTSPITIRWYEGVLGNTTQLRGTGASLTVSPSATTQYWAQASNACGQANTNQVTVTVVSSCEAPEITEQPEGTTIQPGETATLSVVATGTSLSYQWFQVSGDSSTPISGAIGSVFETPALEESATYFVRVSNSCGSQDSMQVTVTVSECEAPAIVQQPQSMSVRGGEHVILSVTATGAEPLSYQWFEGTSGAPSVPISGETSSTLDLGLARQPGTDSYWVQITNECGSVDSDTAVVTVEILRRRGVRRP